ncbi:MAG TPA: TIGR00282 family metallophosphoesterase [Thermoanaerobaculia bacterium]|nr:TIGR00282 family metallophosphoesterase [Thermoanaerobaculia bacterium]HUM29412.1 TIGR00282 family metallophosphoesterase [Thermoanaerobaculia bacterium]HXK67658.1 TIGR00282 family metallophosphoesterase [Thermoanaerobaculia bacterium]
MPSKLTLLFLGDVVGRAGRQLLLTYLPPLVKKVKSNLTIVNIENIAGGKGPNLRVMEEIEDLPIDVYTTGSHFFDQKEFVSSWEHFPRVIRPANYPEGNPGYDHYTLDLPGGEKVTVLQLMGRTFMYALACPFAMADDLIKRFSRTGPIIIDFHAEATSEKTAFGHYVDGRVSAVLGTHTHIPTADETILPGGTAYITDAGMVGAYDGVIGFKKDIIIEKFLMQTPRRFEPANGRPRMSAVVVTMDSKKPLAYSIQRFFVSSEEDIESLILS